MIKMYNHIHCDRAEQIADRALRLSAILARRPAPHRALARWRWARTAAAEMERLPRAASWNVHEAEMELQRRPWSGDAARSLEGERKWQAHTSVSAAKAHALLVVLVDALAGDATAQWESQLQA